jgi:hypothetical protein
MDNDLLKAGTENFNLPHDVVPLPTGGLFYKSKKKSVKIGYLTAADENLLINASQSNSTDSIILSLLRNKLYEHDLRPEELLDSDIEAILIFLRNTSFGPEYNVTLTDTITQKPFSITVTLDELNITKTNVSPDENGLLTTQLPRSNSFVKLKPLTFGDTLEIDKLSEQYPVGRVAPKVTWKLNKQIVEVDGSTDRGFISQFIESMPIMDSKYIRTFLRENIPSLDLKKQVKTPSGEIVNFNITFGVEFFRPFF